MMGEELNATRVGTKGFHGDRVFALADAETGKIASAKNPSKWPTLFTFRAAFTEPLNGSDSLPPARITFPDGSTVSTEDKDIATRLSFEPWQAGSFFEKRARRRHARRILAGH